MLHEHLTEKLNSIRAEIVNAISDTAMAKKVYSINLNTPLMYQYVDEQTNQVICDVDFQSNVVGIDDGWNSKIAIPLDEMGSDILLAILEALEEDNFEIEEGYDD